MSRASSCWAGPEPAVYQAFGTETRAVPALTCQGHAGDTAAALFTAQASLVLLTPLGRREPRRSKRNPYPETSEILEQVKRVGAFSGDPEVMRQMETELHTAVLAAIADGAPGAQEMAATALMTLRYGHDRRTR